MPNCWAGIYRSTDGGKTWGDFSQICHPCSEVNVLRLKSGRILAAARFQGPRLAEDFTWIDELNSYRRELVKNLVLTYSDDGGRTWAKP